MAEAKEHVAAAIAQAQADLEDALAALEKVPDFAASSLAFAAHALNNYFYFYLTIAGGTVQLLLMRLADNPDPQVTVWLKEVRHVTDLMVRTVSHLMNASVTTDTQLRFEKADSPTMVQRVCDYYRHVADRKAIRIHTDFAADVPLVWTDRVAVAAVLDNLLSNAIKYSQPGKQIWVRVRAEEGWAVCDVQDEGPGLSSEDQAKLFQKGVRLTPTPTAGEPSTGYGLAVAKELIAKLNGRIACQSTLGQGSCFTFRLPAYQGESAKLPM